MRDDFEPENHDYSSHEPESRRLSRDWAAFAILAGFLLVGWRFLELNPG
jgi:hypothetical protein